MAAKKSGKVPSDAIALYDKLIATVPGVERKGDTIPYTSLNGHMFSAIGDGGVLRLRLPKAELTTFLEKYKTEQPVAYGIVLKEYAVVPPALFKKTKELSVAFRKSYDYVASLKPKATKKGG